ncbi:hypothetical protein [Cellulomonas sp. C5510]|uniref:hypothetical protein n=1 Tax=Cellulomonas sp. C5510 TaxID=2871170 RepID=UPI001C93C9B9|nr:hypothetical protein [Cellulomonas sp. C5510]QZN86816.1 hypothetical protein K5O09_06795 [Cellulomonas sp. C5510]
MRTTARRRTTTPALSDPSRPSPATARPAGPARHRAPGPARRPRRALLALGGLAGVVVLATGTTITHAAFTDTAEADLGTVGGAYDIALVDGSGATVQGDDHPLVVDTVVPGPDGATAIEVDVVTTTAATGTVTLTVENARTAPLPTDPGVPGPGADPYDVARFTVSVDGQVVASEPADGLGPLTLTGFETGVPRRVQVAATLDPALGNPYYSGRAMVLGLRFDGTTG